MPKKDPQAAYRRKWGIPDWRDVSAYPTKLSDIFWRWEFLRRLPEYRKDWETYWPLTRKIFKRIQSHGYTWQRLNNLRRSDDFQQWNEAISLELSHRLDLRGLGVRPFTWDSWGIIPGNPASWRALMPGRSLVEKYRLSHGLPNPACQRPESLCFAIPERNGFLNPSRYYFQFSKQSLELGHCAVVFDFTKPLPSQIQRVLKELPFVAEDWRKALRAQREAVRADFAVVKGQLIDRSNPKPPKFYLKSLPSILLNDTVITVKKRSQKSLWPVYLRVADARGEGVTLLEIYSQIIGDTTDCKRVGREYYEKQVSRYLKAARRLAF
ncbi:MAG: hypothetical protein HY343_13490 [Lentisphaerae bacterium]|nr:hypothetical protein [Lentisphaerota bacterium]